MEDRTEMISVAQHEKEMTRMETANRRWFVAFMVVLVMLFATNAAWVIYESQFQDVVITQDADSGDGGANYLNGTEDDAAVVPTPSINVRRLASLTVTRIA